jgi:hypothetical protein
MRTVVNLSRLEQRRITHADQCATVRPSRTVTRLAQHIVSDFGDVGELDNFGDEFRSSPRGRGEDEDEVSLCLSSDISLLCNSETVRR